jgi:hypothetical protein
MLSVPLIWGFRPILPVIQKASIAAHEARSWRLLYRRMLEEVAEARKQKPGRP